MKPATPGQTMETSPAVPPRSVPTSQQAERQTERQKTDEQILLAVSGDFPEHVVCSMFLQMAAGNLNAVGTCYLAPDEQDLWIDTRPGEIRATAG